MKEEALKLADDLEDSYCEGEKLSHVSKTIRQLVDRINVLETVRKDKQDCEDKIWEYVKQLEKKVINLAFDLEYSKRTDEFVKKDLKGK